MRDEFVVRSRTILDQNLNGTGTFTLAEYIDMAQLVGWPVFQVTNRSGVAIRARIVGNVQANPLGRANLSPLQTINSGATGLIVKLQDMGSASQVASTVWTPFMSVDVTDDGVPNSLAGRVTVVAVWRERRRPVDVVARELFRGNVVADLFVFTLFADVSQALDPPVLQVMSGFPNSSMTVSAFGNVLQGSLGAVRLYNSLTTIDPQVTQVVLAPQSMGSASQRVSNLWLPYLGAQVIGPTLEPTSQVVVNAFWRE